jgi:hypothetical protein
MSPCCNDKSKLVTTVPKEKAMKKEKTKLSAKEPVEIVAESATETSAPGKKKKIAKKVDEAPAAEPKAKKPKAEKSVKEQAAPKEQKAPKEDKLTKFLVSMKKPVRKSIKKEAAETGISMNDFIVAAVEDKLSKASN